MSVIVPPLQGQNISFHHLTTDNGLSQFSVNGLYIDENGTLWIGTREGLNRYNGNDIKAYKLQKDDPHSLFCNNVLQLTGNHNGRIYLRCTEGIAELDLTTQQFRTLLQGEVHSIYYHNALYMGRRNEIYRYNEQTGSFDLYYQLPDRHLEIYCMHQADGALWLGTTTDGVYRLQQDKNELTHPIPQGNITSIYQDSRGELWIGSWENGLTHVRDNGEIEVFRHDARNPHSLSSDFVRACCEDNLGNIWAGTFNGLNRYDRTTGHFQNHTANDATSDGLTHSSIWCIVKDPQGTLWMGTYFGGVNYFNPEYEIYSQYLYSTTEGEGLSNPVVGRTLEDREGNLWIGTEGGGLNYYNRHTGKFKWYRPTEGANSLSQNNVKALYYDDAREMLWIGTHLGGLNRLDLRTGRFAHYRAKAGDVETLPSDIVRDIASYQDQLVIATQNGVCLFNPADGRCRQLFKESREGQTIKMVADIAFDRDGTLWIAATGEGVFSYRFDTGKLTNYRHDPDNPHSLSNNNVNHIAQDSQGNLWFATSGSGLDLYRPQSNDFENLDQAKNGLASNCIYSLQESPVSHRLLLVTNKGFSILDPQDRTFRNYSAENGFPLTAVNENSLCVTRDGEIFLGGIQGMLSFHETELDFTPKPYRINLSRLIVNGTEIEPGDETGILKQTLAHTSEITLHADQTMFTVEFATSNYVAANKDNIIYRLEGFSKEWNSTRCLHHITYTNLNPGTYKLIIKSEGKDESLCPPAQLTIHVLPPYYKTPLAYLLYLTVAATLFWYLVRTYKSRIKLRESLKYEQQHIQNVEALNQSKLRFFTNISHEFRTPLTLIVGQIELFMQKNNLSPEMLLKLEKIHKNALHLRFLITELLDFRKQEQGYLKLKVECRDIVSLTKEVYASFQELAASRRIGYTFESTDKEQSLWFDPAQMQKVFYNLISNAFKYTDDGGSIHIYIKQVKQSVEVGIKDTGCGIPPHLQKMIFERFYQIGNEQWNGLLGSGIGLAFTKAIVETHRGEIEVESTVGQGSCFKVRLPMGNEHFTKEELAHEPAILPEINWQTNIVPTKEANADETAGSHPQSDEAGEDNRPVVLLVEDDTEMLDMLTDIFSSSYQVRRATNGQMGLEMAIEIHPDLIVSDVMMPVMSGKEMCYRIKNNLELAYIPVVLLTAQASEDCTIEGYMFGTDEYIVKPFNVKLLLTRCRNLLNTRKLLLKRESALESKDTPNTPILSVADQALLDHITEIIRHHFDNPEFDMNLLASELNMGRSKMFARIKEITGLTPNEYTLKIKLTEALRMLQEEPQLNISEISYSLGFTSPRYFSRCFKTFYGVTPQSYRKKNEE